VTGGGFDSSSEKCQSRGYHHKWANQRQDKMRTSGKRIIDNVRSGASDGLDFNSIAVSLEDGHLPNS
jgi:hypothetical protein